MFRRPIFSIALAVAATAAATTSAAAQRVESASRVVVVKLIDQGGGRYAFSPAAVTVEHGDTLRFINEANMMHNVHFIAEPHGAHLGAVTSGPYVTNKDQMYSILIDSRFTDGTYKFVCDPHQSLGMTATLTVADPTTKANGGQ